ncbi:MAG: hypothetical protein EPN94_11655 [Nitrospirae bacterium]|nr:MAG: hypothetical protein EPN94_11655 [Nitrospirota bacterium]
MKAELIKYVKAVDEFNNTIKIKIWQLPESSEDKPHRYKYSLVYIVEDVRVIGYDNAEGKGDHRHYESTEKPYSFKSIERLLDDFYKDMEHYKGGKHES